jgi:hypothetical protein
VSWTDILFRTDLRAIERVPKLPALAIFLDWDEQKCALVNNACLHHVRQPFLIKNGGCKFRAEVACRCLARYVRECITVGE